MRMLLLRVQGGDLNGLCAKVGGLNVEHCSASFLKSGLRNIKPYRNSAENYKDHLFGFRGHSPSGVFIELV